MPFKTGALCAFLALLLALPLRAQTAPAPLGAKAPIVTVTVAQRRALLEGARQKLFALAKRSGGGARDATAILKSLVAPQNVRRADGATQSANGNRWDALAAGAGYGEINIKALKPAQSLRLRDEIALEIGALDAWDTKMGGAYYQPVDGGKIVANLEKSGQIRTGPTWAQAQIGGFWKRVGDAIDGFFKWLAGLFSRTSPPPVTAPIQTTWNGLIFIFWALIISLLGVLAFFVYRAFAGNLRWNRRTKKTGDEELQGEDAELLLLPPDELGARAAGFAREGNFREALRHRYIALLLRLDGRGFWRYDARRTNWEHIAALRRQSAQNGAAMVTPLADLTRRFDHVRYGDAACDEASWERFENDAQSLENQAGARETAGVTR